ncbi:MAG: hypothetical protein PV344_02170 [Anaplasma sp.]|nr:hypothetical protein [Anaplasma sp.]
MERESVIGPRSHRRVIRFSCSLVTQVTQRPSLMTQHSSFPSRASVPHVA